MSRAPDSPLLSALVTGMVIGLLRGLLIPDARWWDALMVVLLVVLLVLYLWRAWSQR
jgi:membrane protein implicated in regulation of membrane protease activity